MEMEWMGVILVLVWSKGSTAIDGDWKEFWS
jgi:hypothetical protein